MSDVPVAYVVMAKPPDDHPAAVRLFGPWFTQAQAADFCERIRKACDNRLELGHEDVGYAYVLRLELGHLKKAKRWALTGEL